jgi:hypothetical protein
MPGLGVDVILGMNWMKQWEVVIDTAKRVVSLKEPVKAGTFLVPLPSRTNLQSMSCATKVTSIQNVLVVCEFSDVFPDELPRLPLDRDIEFAIELVPGTVPISRRPYRMPPNELAELKK